MRALERETGVEADVLGEDAAFLRTLVMDGRWDETITLLEVCASFWTLNVCASTASISLKPV